MGREFLKGIGPMFLQSQKKINVFEIPPAPKLSKEQVSSSDLTIQELIVW